MATNARKHTCTICEKQVLQLSRHVRLKHHIHPYNRMIPQTLREFVEMIVLFPIALTDWKLICKQRESIIAYLENDTPLPSDIFSIVYQAYDQYKKSPSTTNRMALLKPNITKKNKHNECKNNSSIAS